MTATHVLLRTPVVRDAVGDRARAEAPFATPVGDSASGFVLFGFMDLLRLDGDRATVLDYKSGSTGAQEELLDRYRLQAECYAYAVLRGGAHEVEVVFIRPEVIESDGSAQCVRFEFAQADVDRVETALLERYCAIKESQFERRADWDRFTCESCPLFGIACDIERPKKDESV